MRIRKKSFRIHNTVFNPTELGGVRYRYLENGVRIDVVVPRVFNPTVLGGCTNTWKTELGSMSFNPPVLGGCTGTWKTELGSMSFNPNVLGGVRYLENGVRIDVL